MEIWFKKLIADISFLMMRVLDGFFSLFNIYSGLENVQVNDTGETVDILTFFAKNEDILTAFFCIMLVSVGILFFFTFAGMVKTMVNTKRTAGKVLVEFGGSVIAFVLVWVLFFGIVFVGNYFLKEIDMAISGGNNLTMSQRIINIAVDENGWRKKDNDTYYSANDFVLPTTADEFFGYYKKNTLGLEESSEVSTSVDEEGNEIYNVEHNTYRKGGKADLYKTNLFLLFITPLVLFILIFITLIMLAKRVFEVVFLYLSMPLSISTIPLDDGAKFKVWKDVMFSKLFSVYGTVIALNLYLIFLGLLDKITLVDKSNWVKILFDFIFIIGGALAASGGAALFGQLIGATPDAGKNLGQTLYTGMMMGQAAHGVAHGLTTALVGRKGGMGAGGGAGGRSGGLIQGLGKALNIGGKILGGNKFDNFSKSASSGYQNLKNTLKGSYMNNNGLLGLGQKAAGAATWGLMGKKNREFFNTLSGKGGDKK